MGGGTALSIVINEYFSSKGRWELCPIYPNRIPATNRIFLQKPFLSDKHFEKVGRCTKKQRAETLTKAFLKPFWSRFLNSQSNSDFFRGLSSLLKN
jgi:hypothetical protein